MSLNQITKNVGDVCEVVKRQFGDEAGVQISDEDIIRWINSGQLEAARKNKISKRKVANDITAGVNEYNLDSLRIVQIESVHVNGSRLPSREFPQAELDIADLDTDAASAVVPLVWYVWGDLLYLYPTPTASTAGGLTVYYSAYPETIVSLTDTLGLPDKYFEAIVNWCMYKAYQLDEEFETANYERAQFTAALDEENESETQAAHTTYPTITFVED